MQNPICVQGCKNRGGASIGAELWHNVAKCKGIRSIRRVNSITPSDAAASKLSWMAPRSEKWLSSCNPCLRLFRFAAHFFL